MRLDGRQPDQLRPVRIQTGYLLTAEGSALIEVGNTRVPLTISLGLAWTANVHEHAGTVLQAADDALYRAKAQGRNRVEAHILDLVRP